MRKIALRLLLLLSLALLYRRYRMAAESKTEKLLLDNAPANPDQVVRLDVSTGESVSLYDQLGPTVVGTDGVSRPAPLRRFACFSDDSSQKLSKIANWAQFGEVERANILRVLGARNKKRLETLKAAMSENAASEE